MQLMGRRKRSFFCLSVLIDDAEFECAYLQKELGKEGISNEDTRAMTGELNTTQRRLEDWKSMLKKLKREHAHVNMSNDAMDAVVSV